MPSRTETLPADGPNQTYVTIHALSAGHLTLPEHLFCSPSVAGNRKTVPSLSFLIHHRSPSQENPTRLVFDLGLRRDPEQYVAPIREHIKTRQPMTTQPDVSESLHLGGLESADVDAVFLSHVHWDHVGTPADFSRAVFVVGNGSLALLKNGGDTSTGGHAHFERDLLPEDRTVELPPPEGETNGANGVNGSHTNGSSASLKTLKTAHWAPLAHFPAAIDVFSDGSVYIVNAPGHLQGHINLLARTGPKKWVYLGGDACHDRRILRQEVQTAEWTDSCGHSACIHVDKKQAEETLERIRVVEGMQDVSVETILAHDVEWSENKSNKARFWPGSL